jgi:glycine cleavage system H protein
MNIPNDRVYADSHEWLKIEGDTGTVGITDHAQHELTDVVYVELPKIGVLTTAKNPIAVVESVKAASDIYAPASGEIIEVNKELQSNPALINTDPHQGGWIFKIKLSNPAEAKTLKTAQDYAQQIGAA